ncbi:MAG: Unknown protein [uncultured Sulfurovum sp.]|uniref:Uncharacterized protein n=1 Tax=uncultured Sulfurovum sp. TaxID=269237 RepID=A0A6S6U4Y2_9BACT|nr:MAG: Unknown protein [uncultured Sulfurovum sp.]
MSEEKVEALKQINEIKNHLIDRQTFFPYNYNATYVWSVIAIVLSFIMASVYEKGIAIGTVVVFVFVTIGFVSEGLMTKKVNKSYDIEDCTIRQRFIMKNFMFMAWFLIALSAVLATYQLYIAVYLSWLFLVSLGYFAVGHVLNIPNFSKVAQFNMVLSIVLLGVGLYQEHLVGIDSNCFRLVQIAVIIGLGVFPSIVAWKQQKAL